MCTHRGGFSGLYAWTLAHAMIESNDGKINSSGLVSGLSRANLPAGRARSGHAQSSDGPTPSMRITGAPRPFAGYASSGRQRGSVDVCCYLPGRMAVAVPRCCTRSPGASDEMPPPAVSRMQVREGSAPRGGISYAATLVLCNFLRPQCRLVLQRSRENEPRSGLSSRNDREFTMRENGYLQLPQVLE